MASPSGRDMAGLEILLLLYVVKTGSLSMTKKTGSSSMTEKTGSFEYRNMHSSYQITETRWLGHFWRISLLTSR
ncbi:hypothetical protein EUGRSUZ_E03016 [Eucalyptus grandis]|uniref:Uncharacterized protein n=2 Tax=Eucalyptus grandis TaxID=71139 RepID=A0ACC3L210_EUCGR|nr:hypothetical protein EUGRSUZ_E03016 [Eucalyptus grandis]